MQTSSHLSCAPLDEIRITIVSLGIKIQSLSHSFKDNLPKKEKKNNCIYLMQMQLKLLSCTNQAAQSYQLKLKS